VQNVEYEVFVSVDLANSVEPVADVVKNLNSHLSTMGVDERATVRSEEFRLWTVTSDRELQKEELTKMKSVIQETVDRVDGNRFGLVVSDIRKSFSQSCSKSA
jgi:hypothetical protein